MAAGPQPQSLVAAMDPETIMMTTCIFLSHTETVYVYMLICRERERERERLLVVLPAAGIPRQIKALHIVVHSCYGA